MADVDYLPNSDAKLSSWLANFLAVAAVNLPALHLTLSDLDTLDFDTGAFNSKNAAVVTAKQTAKAATVSRVSARRTAAADARLLVRRIQNTDGVSDTLKRQLGITVSAGRRPEVPVFQVVNLVAAVAPDLSIKLKWDKNGNHYSTLYVIERKCGTDTTWTSVKTQTSTRFSDTGCAPGTKATYRVTATRRHLTSQPSMEVVVYPAQG